MTSRPHPIPPLCGFPGARSPDSAPARRNLKGCRLPVRGQVGEEVAEDQFLLDPYGSTCHRRGQRGIPWRRPRAAGQRARRGRRVVAGRHRLVSGGVVAPGAPSDALVDGARDADPTPVEVAMVRKAGTSGGEQIEQPPNRRGRPAVDAYQGGQRGPSSSAAAATTIGFSQIRTTSSTIGVSWRRSWRRVSTHGSPAARAVASARPVAV